jgi:hypothetical protein
VELESVDEGADVVTVLVLDAPHAPRASAASKIAIAVVTFTFHGEYPGSEIPVVGRSQPVRTVTCAVRRLTALLYAPVTVR